MRSYAELTNFMGLCEDLKDNIKAKAVFKNTARYEQEFAFLYNIFFNSFGMKEGTCPDTMDERTVKRALIGIGKFCQFIDEGDLPYGLPCTPGGTFTKVYGYPVSAFVYSYMGFYKEVPLYQPNGSGHLVRETVCGNAISESETKGFIIKCNQVDLPPVQMISQYAFDMSDTLRTLDVQRVHMKTPGYLSVKEEAKNAIKRINKSRENNEEMIDVGIYGADALGAVPYIIPSDVHRETKNDYEWYYHQYMNRIGFNTNSSPDKAANLTEDEVNSDALLSAFNIQSMVDYLNYQQEMINEVHGTKIVWEVKHPLAKFETSKEDKKESEDKENE